MNQSIMNFEHACKETYDSKLKDEKYGPKLWVQKAIQDKLFSNSNKGFTRSNGARDLIDEINDNVVLLSFIDVMIKAYDLEHKYGNNHENKEACHVVHHINSKNGMEDLMEQLRYGMFLSQRSYNGDKRRLTNEEEYYLKSFDNILEKFVSSNLSFNLLACNSKLVSFDAQKAQFKLDEYIKENSYGMGHSK